MKKNESYLKLFSLILGFVAFGLNGQIFDDGFELSEGYNVGDYIGPGPNGTWWTTWTGAEGGVLDAKVVSSQAHTGSNSILFSEVSGGQEDVILDYGQQYVNGTVIFQTAMYVTNGHSSYMVMQGTQVPGQYSAFLAEVQDGTLYLKDVVDVTGQGTILATSYSYDTWITLRVETNISTGIWKAYINGQCVATWFSQIVGLAGVELFASNNTDFYIDDIFLDYIPDANYSLNLALAQLDMKSNVANVIVNPSVIVVNDGSNTINSFNIDLDYDGQVYNGGVTGINLNPGESYEYTFTTPITLSASNLLAAATITSVNGIVDDNQFDDFACNYLESIVPPIGKMVIGESKVSTLGGAAPATYIFFDKFESKFQQYWYGIEYHSNDTLDVIGANASIDSLLNGIGASAVDRKTTNHAGSNFVFYMDEEFYNRLVVSPNAQIINGAQWDSVARELTVSVTGVFDNSIVGNFRTLCILTEDSISGLSSDFDQANGWNVSPNGFMVKPYDTLPDPVPATQMIYNRVARAMAPSFYGEGSCYPANINGGDTITHQYSFVLPLEWDVNNINIVGIILDSSDRVDNANVVNIEEGVNNGLRDACTVSVAEFYFNSDNEYRLFPNPASQFTNLLIDPIEAHNIRMQIVDQTGREIISKNYGEIAQPVSLSINTSLFTNGLYFINLYEDDRMIQFKLEVAKN